jgi:hypothetical protein
MPDNYVFSQFKLYAMIEDIGRVDDIVALSGNFALNTIPTAALILACGINATTNAQASAHSKIMGKIKSRARVSVYLEVDTTDGYKEKMPSEKTFMVFDGYYAGFGFQRSNNNANYTLHLVHWLDDLNIGSMLNGQWFPGAPFNVADNAGYYTATNQAQGSGFVMAPAIDPDNQIITYSNITNDLWGDVLKPVLTVIAGWGTNKCATGVDTEHEKKIKAALEKMPGAAPNKVKLGLNLDGPGGLTGDLIRDSVNDALTKVGVQAFSYSTFWSKLTGEYAPQFLFALSPGVDFAQVVPVFGGLKWRDGDKVIYADEYGYANFMGNTRQTLGGIDIIWPASFGSGLVAGTPVQNDYRPPSFCDPPGLFPSHEDRKKKPGTVLVKEPPSWFGNIMSKISNTSRTAGLNGSVLGANNDASKGADATEKAKKESELQQNIKDSPVLDRFAEQWFKTELLQQRYGEFSGKLRFDVAPGSVIKIKAPTENMPRLSDNTDMIATVVQVSFSINAENATAGTAFSVSHIRSPAENNDRLIAGSDTPPLYNERWSGGPLSSKIKYT